jgi:hypothetical protein
MCSEILQQYFDTPTEEHWKEVRMVSKSGKDAWCKFTTSLIVGSDGLPKFLLMGLIPEER